MSFYHKKHIVGDLFLFIFIVLIITGFYINKTKYSNELAVKVIFNDIEKIYDISKDNEISLKDGKIKIVIKDKKVAIVESDCKQQICVYSGWISHPGEQIICVPNKLFISIIGRDKFDSVSQ